MGSYILPTIIWGLFAVFCYLLPSTRYAGKLRLKRTLYWLAWMCVFIAALGTMLAGAMGGFGRSPYDHSITGILINAVTLIFPLFVFENSRAWLMNRHFSKHPLFGIVLLSLLFSFLLLPLNKILILSEGIKLVKFLGMDVAPLFCENMLATYLTFLGGPWTAIIYRGGLLAIEYLSPVLANNSWVNQTLLGSLAPILGIIMVRQIYGEEAGLIRKSRQNEGQLGWIFTCVASIIVLWFAMGIFTYAPKVILTGSMEPAIMPGDIVIVHKTSTKAIEDINLGDIIMFPMDNIKVTHRVIAVQNDKNMRLFKTKGDANGTPDTDLIPEAYVQGKVVMIVPKLGMLALLLHGG